MANATSNSVTLQLKKFDEQAVQDGTVETTVETHNIEKLLNSLKELQMLKNAYGAGSSIVEECHQQLAIEMAAAGL